MSSQSHIVTLHGAIAVEESNQGRTPVVFLHGNSSCRRVFRHQLEMPLAANYRMIAFDFPGHGQSNDATDPQRTYTLPGLADATGEFLRYMGVSSPIVVGWSLGGHVAIQTLSQGFNMRAMLLCGSPPVGKRDGVNDMGQGFKTSPRGAVVGKEVWSAEEVQSFVYGIFGDSAEPFLLEAAMRTDPRFRKRLFESSREGDGTDQRRTVESASIPIAVINGAEDPVIQLDYFDTVALRNLWSGKVHRLPEAGHAPFWQKPHTFNDLFEHFLLSVKSHEKQAPSTKLLQAI